jgi:hypothetical protein
MRCAHNNAQRLNAAAARRFRKADVFFAPTPGKQFHTRNASLRAGDDRPAARLLRVHSGCAAGDMQCLLAFRPAIARSDVKNSSEILGRRPPTAAPEHGESALPGAPSRCRFGAKGPAYTGSFGSTRLAAGAGSSCFWRPRGASSMKRFVGLALVGLASFLLSTASAPAEPDLQNDQIEIAYVEPTNPDFTPYYTGLKARHVLEELRAFLAPLKLPRKIEVKVDQCNAPTHLYEPGGPVVICYEYVARLNELAAKIPADGTSSRGVSRDDAVVGAFVQAVLQQTASAVFDVFNTPIWGREQDAADKLAAFLMLQFGSADARKLLNGAAYFFEASDRTWTGSDFSDVRGTEAQRFYNYLCIAFGFDKRTFADFAGGQATSGAQRRSDLLPSSRMFWCPKEYGDEQWAFDSLIMPHVDKDLLQKVLARKWLRPND